MPNLILGPVPGATKHGPALPSGYTALRGKNPDASYVFLRGQTSAGVYINLLGKVS